MGTPQVTAIEMAKRKQDAQKLLEGHDQKLRERIVGMVGQSQLTVLKLKTRLRRLQESKAPITKSALTTSDAWFDAYLKRHKTGMTNTGETVYKYLREQGLSTETARQFARAQKGKQFSIEGMKNRVEYLKGIKLDPQVYGVEQIPIEVIEKLLARKPSDLKKGIKKALVEIEDAHSAKLLDKLRPGWRNEKSLSVHAGKRISPTRILRNLRLTKEHGIKQTVKVLSQGSVLTIPTGRAASYYTRGETIINGQKVLKPRKLGIRRAQTRLEVYEQRARELEVKNDLTTNSQREYFFERTKALYTDIKILKAFIAGKLPVSYKVRLEQILKELTKQIYPELR